ncbi:MAG: DUF2062 domain-containing protein [Pirellulaceae bacterium]|jgi:hypothetical protein|nr:DUF2062 domain-containing protein [Pirellulaceae bacterium]
MYRRHVRARFRIYLRNARAFIYQRVLHADDPPHELALGGAIGMFVAFTPTVGFQMVENVFLAWLLRANKAIGVPIVWITNPATMVPIYYCCYVVGRTMLGSKAVHHRWWQELSHPPAGWWAGISFYWSRLMEIAVPLWLGCVVVGILLAYPTYYLLYYGICTYRMRRWGQLIPPVGRRHAHERAGGSSGSSQAGALESTGAELSAQTDARVRPPV